jgi:HSP20 family molecular chaperone IbpA
MLSQQKIGQSDDVEVLTLPHTATKTATTTEVKVEVPGIDPSTIEVGFVNNQLQIHCEHGSLSIPVDPAVDTSKIRADILWGLLTVVIPLPEAPEARTIKVSIHDSAPPKKPVSKTAARVQAEAAELTEEEA